LGEQTLNVDDPARDPSLLQFQLRVARAPDQVRRLIHSATPAALVWPR